MQVVGLEPSRAQADNLVQLWDLITLPRSGGSNRLHPMGGESKGSLT
jgi:hypothetical protein